MKAVVVDGYTLNPGDLYWNDISAVNDLTVYDRTSADKIVERIGDAEIVLTNKTPITKETMEQCPNIQFITVLATGYDVIDIKTAKEKGIVVSNVPSYGTECVSQFAIALLLEVCNRIGHHDAEVKKGKWTNCKDWCFWDYPLIELSHKTMGIIGYGRIGQNTGKIARALGMNVLAYDKYENPDLKDVKYVSLNTLCKKSDVIVLHCSLNAENKEIINKSTLGKMKSNAILINNARGGLVNEQDLADALNSKKIQAAAVDVVSTEPIHDDNPLLQAKNCIITPHMSWGAKEARQRIMSITNENIQKFIEGNPQNRVA